MFSVLSIPDGSPPEVRFFTTLAEAETHFQSVKLNKWMQVTYLFDGETYLRTRVLSDGYVAAY